MKKAIMLLLASAITTSFALTIQPPIVSIDNTTVYHAHAKLIEPHTRTECSNEISIARHESATVSASQLSCDTKLLRLKVYGMIEANAKTSNIFKVGSHCTIRQDKPLDDRFHVNCE